LNKNFEIAYAVKFVRVCAGGNHTVRNRTALLVSIPAAVTLLVLLLVALYLCKRNRKPRRDVQVASVSKCQNNTTFSDDDRATIYMNDRLCCFLTGNEEEADGMASSESLLYNLSTLRAATDNFSVENKLGEGGFGPVHKVTLNMQEHQN